MSYWILCAYKMGRQKHQVSKYRVLLKVSAFFGFDVLAHHTILLWLLLTLKKSKK